MPQDGEQILLREEIPHLSLTFNDAVEPKYQESKKTGWFDASSPNSGANNRYWAFQSEIDVSGWGVKGLTFYPSGYVVQAVPIIEQMDGALVRRITLISQNPFDVHAWVEFTNLSDYVLPGQMAERGNNNDLDNEPLGFEDILGGNYQVYANSASIMPTRTGLVVSEEEFGSLEPTATDRLYVTSLVWTDNLAPQVAGSLVIPVQRVILSGIAASENMLSYIMRLKNSFKLTQTDVGLIED